MNLIFACVVCMEAQQRELSYFPTTTEFSCSMGEKNGLQRMGAILTVARRQSVLVWLFLSSSLAGVYMWFCCVNCRHDRAWPLTANASLCCMQQLFCDFWWLLLKRLKIDLSQPWHVEFKKDFLFWKFQNRFLRAVGSSEAWHRTILGSFSSSDNRSCGIMKSHSWWFAERWDNDLDSLCGHVKIWNSIFLHLSRVGRPPSLPELLCCHIAEWSPKSKIAKKFFRLFYLERHQIYV